jgi:prepilin-type N-terminal cleavage/methylation domain-containing protein
VTDRRRRSPVRSERGETLIEVLIAVVLLTVVGVAGYGGFATASRSSGAQIATAKGETLLRSASEWIQSPEQAYIPRAGCPGAGQYPLPSVPSSTSGYTLSITSVRFWGGAPGSPTAAITPTFTSTCPALPAGDRGLQELTIRATSSSGAPVEITITKRRP